MNQEKFKTNIQLAQLSDSTIISLSTQANAQTHYDVQSTVSVPDLNSDNASLRYSAAYMQPDYESRSLYSISEYEVDNPSYTPTIRPRSSIITGNDHQQLQADYNRILLHHQLETSFTNSIASQMNDTSSNHDTINSLKGLKQQQDEMHHLQSLSLKRKKSFLNRVRPFPKSSHIANIMHNRSSPTNYPSSNVFHHHQQASDGHHQAMDHFSIDQQYAYATNYSQNHPTITTTSVGGGGGGGGLSEDGNASDASDSNDINSKWSWRKLRKEFKTTQTESLFHLYQAKLQQSFFVALLILNIIFNLGAVISYLLSKYHEMNIYLILMRLASIWVMISFLMLIKHNKAWMQSKF